MKNKLSYILFILFFISSCFSDEALVITGAISGSVKESGSGKAIEDANVSLSGGESVQSALTDSSGNFLFGEITSGMYVLDVDKKGYLSASKNSIVNPEKTSISSFSLQKKIPVAQPNSVDLNFKKQEESIALTNKQLEVMNFTTSSSKEWLTISPSTGSIDPSNSVIIKVNADFSSLVPGKYDEKLIINVDGASLTIPVTITYVDPPFITITSPEEDDVFQMGDILPISWVSNLDGKVKIELLKESSIVLNISNDLLNQNGGAYNWTIPSIESDYYKILITSKENEDVTFNTEPFKIDLGATKPVVKTATAASEIGINFIKIGGNIESIGELASKVDQYGHVYSTISQKPSIADSRTKKGEVTEPQNFISDITELQSAKLYYIRAYATNSLGTSYGEVISVSTIAGAPELTTTDPVEITQSSAKLGGNITGDGGSSIIENGLFYGTTNELNTDSEKIKDSGTSSGDFSVDLTGLVKGTKYYVMAYALNSGGYGFGEIKSFYTNGDPPTVETSSISKYSGTKAEVQGKVISNGGEPLVSYGIAYGKSTSPTIEDGKVEVGTEDVESFTAEIADLDISTKYYVRAYATNARGTSYGGNKNFTTSNGLPGVTTVGSEGVNGSTATINGKVDDNGGSPTTSYGFAYAETQNPTIDGFYVEVGKEFEGDYSGKLIDLKSSTKYYVKSYATNANGTSYGDEISFITTDGLPKVNTVGSRDVSGTKATATGTVVDDGGVTLSSYGFVYSESENPTIDGTSIEVGTTINGGFSGSISGLKSLTKYYFRAYATNKIGTSYGLELSFTTFDGMPEVSTVEVKDISVTTVNAVGKIEKDGGETITAYGFVYSKEENPTIEGNKTVVTENTDNVFTGPVGNLTTLTKYYLKAYVTNAAGTAYGEELNFTTIEGPYLTITAPILNQKITIGKTFNIIWDTNKTEGNITIEHWKGSVKTELSNETDITAETFSWDIPSSAAEGVDNFIKITENNDTKLTYESPKFSLSNTTNIPDDEFEKKLIAAGWDDVLDDYVVTANISGLTTLGTALAGGSPIKDLTGIEAFVALENLDISQNELTVLDISKNKNLKVLDVSKNMITELDVSNNSAIETLVVTENKISSLNLVDNNNLKNITIDNNPITALDVSANVNLEEINATYIKFSSLDISNNTKLKKLIINGNNNDISPLASLDLSQNIELTNLGLKSNSLTSLDLTNQSKDKLINLDVSLNPINCILVNQAQLDSYNSGNLSGWIKGSSQVFSIDCSRTYIPDDYFENELINLGYDDVLDNYVTTENIIGVKSLNLAEKFISDITGISSFVSLESIDLFKNDLQNNPDFTSNKLLKTIRLDSTGISSFDVSGLTELKSLKSRYNKITSLDISTNVLLENLEIPGSRLEVLDLTKNIELKSLITGKGFSGSEGDYNFYDRLDLSNNSNLTTWSNISYLTLCVKVNKTQFESIPEGWNHKGEDTPGSGKKNDSVITLGCWDTIAGYQVWKEDGGNANNTIENKRLRNPYDLHVQSNGDVYIADQNRILKWEKDASIGITIAGKDGDSSISRGDSLSEFESVDDIFVDSENNVYAADMGNHRIMKWEPGATQGKKVAGITGEKGSDLNKLHNPKGVVVDSNKNIYIADGFNKRIIKYSYLATVGEVIATGNIFNIAIDENDNLYFVDYEGGGYYQTYKYDISNKEITVIGERMYTGSFLGYSKINYNDGYVYILGNISGYIRRIKIDDGTIEEINYPYFALLRNSHVYTYGLHVKDGYIYLPDSANGVQRVIKRKIILD